MRHEPITRSAAITRPGRSERDLAGRPRHAGRAAATAPWVYVTIAGLAAACVLAVSPRAHALDAEAYRTDVVFLEHMPAAHAVALYERVLGGERGDARIFEGRSPGTVVVRDTPRRLARFRALIAALDEAGAEEARIFVRPVIHLPPSELAATLERVLDGQGGAAVRLIPDDRTEQLVVRTTRDRYLKLDRMIRRLDVPAGDRGRSVRVLPDPGGVVR